MELASIGVGFAHAFTRLLTEPLRVAADDESGERAQVYAGFILIMSTVGLTIGFWIQPAVQRADGLSDTPTLVAAALASVMFAVAYGLARFGSPRRAAFVVVFATVICDYVSAFEDPRMLLFMSAAVVISAGSLPVSMTVVVSLLAAMSPGLLALQRPAIRFGDILYVQSVNVLLPILLLVIAWYQQRIIRERDQSATQMAELVGHSPDGMLAFRPSGLVEAANPAAAVLAGLAPEEMLNRQLQSLGMFDDAVIDQLCQLPTGEAIGARTSVRIDGGRAVDYTARSIEADDGTSMIQLTLRDVEDQVQADVRHREMQMQLDQARRLESLGRLAGGIAHDVNNQLTVVSLGCELAMMTTPTVDLDAAMGAVEHSRALVDQLLTYARQKSLEILPTDVDRVLLDVSPILKTLVRDDVILHLDLQAAGATVFVDKTQLEQVLINLVANGSSAMPAGGRLRVSTAVVDLDEPALPSGRCVKIEVEDTGEGIAPDDLPRVFEPFFTTKRVGSGTGLGLATVHAIVDQSGGTISAEGNLGHGATFLILLPCTVDIVTVATLPTSKPQPRLDDIRALVVDDEPLVGHIVSQALETAGCHTTHFTSSTDALEAVAREPTKFDIVISDVVMPELAGPELVQKLRALNPDIAVVLMSGYFADEDATAEKSITKPFSIASLLEIVAESLASES